MTRAAIIFIILLSTLAACAQASVLTWTAFDVDRDYYGSHNPLITPPTMTFTLENDRLTLDRSHVDTVGGSSAYHWSLLFAGSWSVCGTITDGVYTPDPYATFAESNPGEGSIIWADNTPAGYMTNLILGGAFAGDGAATYQDRNPNWTKTTTGTLVLQRVFLGGYGYEYNRLSHTFEITRSTAPMVPEPSGIVQTLWGLGALAGFVLRRRR